MAEYIEREAAIAAAFSATSLGNSSFRYVYDAVNRLRLIPAADVVPASDFRDCRNELCLRCGQYKTAHLGSCDGCRWRH